MRKKIIIITAWLGLVGMYMAHNANGQQTLSPKIARLINHSKARHAFWAITVRDSTGKMLESRNSHKLIRPASNLKLLTSAAVLEELGPQFTFKTYMYGIGSQEEHRWEGNIIIRGAGDPSISGRFYDDDRFHVLDEFYHMFTSRGITKITGDLIGNDAYFDEKPYPKGWSWNDLTYYYAVPINALSFNNNTVDLTVYAKGRIGATPKIQWFPFNTDYVNFINQQVIAPAKASYEEHYHRLLGTNTIMLSSSLPQGYVEKESLSINDPPRYFMDTLKKYIEDGGIKVEGSATEEHNKHYWRSSTYQKLGVHQSPPLRALIKQLNKKSDNFYAEMLLKTAAAEHYHTQGTTRLGVHLVKNFAASLGIKTTTISMSDGSGMSATDLISSYDLTTLLIGMQHQKYFKDYKQSLPIAGVDGSLKHRFKHSVLRGRLWAKTGYVSGVRTLSGFLRAKDNKTLYFSIATNNYTTSTSYVDAVQESILKKVYARY